MMVVMEGFRDQDFQSSSSPGTNLKVTIVDEHPNTEPFDETAVLDSPSIDTQVMNLDEDTEVLDIPDFVDDLRAQMVDDSEKDVVPDSDDEGIDSNELVAVMKELSSHETEGAAHIADEIPDQDQKQLVPPKHCKLGYLRRRGSKIAAGSQSVEAYCLAGDSLNDMASNCGPNSNHAERLHETALSVNYAMSRIEDQISVVRNVNIMGPHSWQSKQSDLMNETENPGIETKAACSKSDALDGGMTTPVVCDPELAKLSYFESQEPGESSQAALDCVDHYLSVNSIKFPEELKIGTINKIKSLPALSAKGSHSLARVANLRTKDGQSRIFEWDANELDDGWDVFKRKEPLLGWRSWGPRSGSTPHLAKSMTFQEERKLVEQCKSSDLNLVDSRVIGHNSNQISEVRKAAETASRTRSCLEFDEHLDAETSGQQQENGSIERDVLDMDVGFDTQMAAEAIEALLYAPPPNNDANAHQGLENNFEGTPEGKTLEKHCPFSNAGSSDSGFTARQMKEAKRSANKLSRNTSTSFQSGSKNQFELNLSIEVTKKAAGGKSATYKRRTFKTSSNVRTQILEEEFPEKENAKYVGNNRSSSKSLSCNPLGELEESSRRFLPITRLTRHQSSVESSKMPEYATCGFVGKRSELDVINRRKKSGLNRDTLLGVRRKCSKLGADSSMEDPNCKVNQKEQNILKLNPWIFPKRKRTCHSAPHPSELPSQLCTSSIVVDDEDCIKNSGESCSESERKPKTPCSSSIVKRKARSNPKFWYSSEEKYAEGLSTDKFAERSSITGQIARVNSAKAKASRKASKLDMLNPGLSAGVMENRVVDLCKANVQTSTMPRSEKYKQLCKRNSSKLPLLKELTRLGFAEALPNFASKDLRRRRNMADINVLFSQSLDKQIIQKQKKILARLGISMASDCSDATHFVTDRFVRSRKMMETMALGKPVVTPLWLESCSQAKSFIDEKNYILRDTKKEKELGFSMLASLARAREHPLLEDRKVIVTSNVKPSKEMIESLVKAVCGQLVVLPRKNKKISKDLLILSCEQDYGACVPFLVGGAAVYSSELLLNGIVIQKLEYERHQLFKDHVKKNGSTTCWKKERD